MACGDGWALDCESGGSCLNIAVTTLKEHHNRSVALPPHSTLLCTDCSLASCQIQVPDIDMQAQMPRCCAGVHRGADGLCEPCGEGARVDCARALEWLASGRPGHALLFAHCGHVHSPVADSWPQARRSYQQPSAKSAQPCWCTPPKLLCNLPSGTDAGRASTGRRARDTLAKAKNVHICFIGIFCEMDQSFQCTIIALESRTQQFSLCIPSSLLTLQRLVCDSQQKQNLQGLQCKQELMETDQDAGVHCTAGKLFALGVFIQGGVASEGHFPVWDLASLRVFGVLQRIALCFTCASLLVLYVPECQLPKVEVRSPSITSTAVHCHVLRLSYIITCS